MITKEEAKNKLKKAGYNVVDDNSVLTILVSENTSIKNTVKAVKELFLKIDYQASFGIKQHSGAIEETHSEMNEQDEEESEETIELAIEELSDDDIVDSEEKLSEVEKEEAVVEKKKPSKKDNSKAVTKTATKTKNKTENKTKKDKEVLEEDDYLDEEDENFDDIDNVKLDDLDLDMMLNEDSVQFSLEDFGLM